MKYYHYTCIKTDVPNFIVTFKGVQATDTEEFDMVDFYKAHPNCYLVNVIEISEKQYKALSKLWHGLQ